mgnify:CR=1 FL=1
MPDKCNDTANSNEEEDNGLPIVITEILQSLPAAFILHYFFIFANFFCAKFILLYLHCKIISTGFFEINQLEIAASQPVVATDFSLNQEYRA